MSNTGQAARKHSHEENSSPDLPLLVVQEPRLGDEVPRILPLGCENFPDGVWIGHKHHIRTRKTIAEDAAQLLVKLRNIFVVVLDTPSGD